MLNGVLKKRSLFVAARNGAICVALCALVTAVFSLPVYSEKLRLESIGIYLLGAKLLFSALLGALTARSSPSRKLPHALLTGGTALLLCCLPGLIFFGNGTFGSEFLRSAAVLMVGSTLGGMVGAGMKGK